MKLLRCILGLFLGLCLGLAQAGIPVAVKILGFNDFHGNLQSPGAFSGQPFRRRGFSCGVHCKGKVAKSEQHLCCVCW